MIFPSPIISIYGKHGGVQSPDDSRISVPNVILPVMEFPTPVISCQELNTSNAFEQDTFHRDGSWTVTNAAAIDQTFFSLAPGLWDVFLSVRAQANFTNLSKFAFVYVSIAPTIGAAFLFSSNAVTNITDRATLQYRVAIKNSGGYTVSVQVATNGVGESHRLDVAAICNRLG